MFVGDYATGKTSLIRRYTEGFFSPNYKLTIGVDFAVKVSMHALPRQAAEIDPCRR